MYEDGSGRRTVVLSEKGVTLNQVLRKLHERSAKEVNTHIVECGIDHPVTPTEGSDSDGGEDEDEHDDEGHGSQASGTVYDHVRDNDDTAAGGDDGKEVSDEQCSNVATPGRESANAPIRLPWIPGPPVSPGETPGQTCMNSRFPVYTAPYQESGTHEAPQAFWRPPRRLTHRAVKSPSQLPPPPPPPSVGLPSSRTVHFDPLVRPANSSSSGSSSSGNGGAKPALINVDWIGQCSFSMVDKVPLWRTAVVDAALHAVLERRRPDTLPAPRLVGMLKRVRLGGCESDVRCLVDDLDPLLKSMAEAGEAMPAFDVEIRRGPPR